MKSLSFSRFMIAVVALAFATASFAANNGRKESFQIFAPAQINGTQLPAGDYVAKWEGSGPNVQVSLVHNGKTVATVAAKLVESAEKASTDATELQTGSKGDRQLSAVRFSGKKYSLEFSGEATQAAK